MKTSLMIIIMLMGSLNLMGQTQMTGTEIMQKVSDRAPTRDENPRRKDPAQPCP